jgi:hypothetical protein
MIGQQFSQATLGLMIERSGVSWTIVQFFTIAPTKHANGSGFFLHMHKDVTILNITCVPN